MNEPILGLHIEQMTTRIGQSNLEQIICHSGRRERVQREKDTMKLRKLTTLTLSIGLAVGVGVTACGGSDDDTETSKSSSSDGGGNATDTMADDDPAVSEKASCEPTTTQCAGDNVVETCLNDGETWFAASCADGETCEKGACVGSTTCSPGASTCSDSLTRLSCLGDGSGYEKVTCPDSAPCVDGVCAGTVCNVGETRCDAQATGDDTWWEGFNNVGINPSDLSVVYTCVDGSAWVAEPCSTGELCTYDKVAPYDSNVLSNEVSDFFDDYLDFLDYGAEYGLSRPQTPDAPAILPGAVASCQQPECYNAFYNGDYGFPYYEGTSCGDPSDASVSKDDYFTVCTNVAPFGNPILITNGCAAGTMCTGNPDMPCGSQCIPGSEQCDGRGLVTCDANGEWGAPITCMDGKELLDCWEDGQPSASGQRQAMCIDKVCSRYLGGSREDFGTCDGEQIIVCDANGRLAGAPTDCPSGICRQGSTSEYDGLYPGYCEEACVDGASQCTNLSGTFRTCNGGLWTTDQCPSNLSCNNDGDNIVCGCKEGDTRCSGVQVQTCDASGNWGTGADCSYGSCENVDLGSQSSGVCLGQCTPGSFQCNGGGEQRVCNDKGLWDSYTPCNKGTACRKTNNAISLGCVECVGPNLGGNYSFGAADVGCDKANTVTCGADNTWGTPDPACPVKLSCSATTFGSGEETSSVASCKAVLQ